MLSLSISLLSIFVAFIIIFSTIKKSENKASNILLSFYFLLFGLYGIAHQVTTTTTNAHLIYFFLNNLSPLLICIGPILYLYTKSLLEDNRNKVLSGWTLFHLIPFLIIFIDQIPYYFLSFEEKMSIAKKFANNNRDYSLLKHLFFTNLQSALLTQLVTIGYICYAVYYKNLKELRPICEKQFTSIKNWLRILLYANLFFYILMADYFIALDNNSGLRFGFTISTLAIIPSIIHSVIITSILLFPRVLYGLSQYEKEIDSSFENINYKNTIIKVENQQHKKVYKPFELEDTYLHKIHSLVENFILSKPYIEDKFSLSVLTAETKIPTHHLQLYFKEYLHTNFNHWKNDLKIKYAIELIESGILSKITIETIALKAGFKSYSNFFIVFKTQKGITPSEYIEQMSAHYKQKLPEYSI